MMRAALRTRAIFIVAIKRLLAQPLLSLATTVGLTVAVALVLTIPIYSESVAFRILTERLTDGPDTVNRPPFSFMFSYIGSWNEPVNWEATLDLDRFLREQGGTSLGLNATRIVRHLETQNFRLYPAGETNYRDENRSLDYVSFGTTEDIYEQIEVVDGSLPAPADPASDSVIEVIMHEEFASEFGVQAGEYYSGYNWRLGVDNPMQITEIRVAGIWRPRDDESEYWFYRPNVFQDIMIVDEATFRDRISPYSESEVNLAVWYLVTDGAGVNTSRVDELIRRHNETEKTADQYLPGTYIQASPEEELRPYQRIVTVLTLTLTVFSIPIVALLVVFLIMLVGLVVDGQRNETAVMRSRGSSAFQVRRIDGRGRHDHGSHRAGHRRRPGDGFLTSDRHDAQLHGFSLGNAFYRFRSTDYRHDRAAGAGVYDIYSRCAHYRRSATYDNQLQNGSLTLVRAAVVAALGG